MQVSILAMLFDLCNHTHPNSRLHIPHTPSQNTNLTKKKSYPYPVPITFIVIAKHNTLKSTYPLGTTCTSQSAPCSPLNTPLSLAFPSGSSALVTPLSNTPLFSAPRRYSRKCTEVVMYSRRATALLSVVPVARRMIQGTMRGASVQEGCAVPSFVVLVCDLIVFHVRRNNAQVG
jgi:hypothetical protein